MRQLNWVKNNAKYSIGVIKEVKDKNKIKKKTFEITFLNNQEVKR